MQAPTSRKCPHCGADIKGPWFKRFCTAAHRAAYHNERRRAAIEAMQRLGLMTDNPPGPPYSPGPPGAIAVPAQDHSSQPPATKTTEVGHGVGQD